MSALSLRAAWIDRVHTDLLRPKLLARIWVTMSMEPLADRYGTIAGPGFRVPAVPMLMMLPPTTDRSHAFAFKQRNPTTRKELAGQIHRRDRENCSARRQLGGTVALDSGLYARVATERCWLALHERKVVRAAYGCE